MNRTTLLSAAVLTAALIPATVLGAEGKMGAPTTGSVEALQLLMNERPALGILDIGMPTLEGTAVLRIVRTMGDDAPAIMFMTAHGLPSDRADGFELGALDYVVKPFDMRELIVRVNHCLEHERR